MEIKLCALGVPQPAKQLIEMHFGEVSFVAQWTRSQIQLGSGIAVAKASAASSDPTPSLGTSMCFRGSPKTAKRERKKKRKEKRKRKKEGV